MIIKGLLNVLGAGVLALSMVAIAPGCDRKEELIDVETPDGGVEVERDKETGEVDVDVDD